MDCTKELCSDNRHRILHTMWGIYQVIIPIFGHTLTNTSGKKVNVKDIFEQDHILPDYHNRFIPTLSDFVKAMHFEANDTFKKNIDTCFKRYQQDRWGRESDIPVDMAKVVEFFETLKVKPYSIEQLTLPDLQQLNIKKYIYYTP